MIRNLEEMFREQTKTSTIQDGQTKEVTLGELFRKKIDEL